MITWFRKLYNACQIFWNMMASKSYVGLMWYKSSKGDEWSHFCSRLPGDSKRDLDVELMMKNANLQAKKRMEALQEALVQEEIQQMTATTQAKEKG